MKLIHKNKKAFFDYEILQQFKAGMMLLGSEIKSIRKGDITLKGAYISIQNGKPILKGAHIARYAYDTNSDYEPFRDRELLLNQNEIYKIENQLNTQGVSLIPLAVVLEGKYAKLEMGLARGKKKHDKRDALKSKDTKREISRAIKRFV